MKALIKKDTQILVVCLFDSSEVTNVESGIEFTVPGNANPVFIEGGSLDNYEIITGLNDADIPSTDSSFDKPNPIYVYDSVSGAFSIENL